MKPGTRRHRDLFCREFTRSHLQFEPRDLPWPILDEEQTKLLRAIPFWEIARDTEREAGVLVTAMAATVDDPVIRDAIALQGFEEERHARLIQTLIERYGIEVKAPEPIPVPKDVRRRFTDFGYEECLESYFAFGLFRVAHEADIFPEAFFEIFEKIITEEVRHITYFINWFVYDQVQRGAPWSLPPFRASRAAWHYSRAVKGLVDSFREGSDSGFGFTATGAGSLTRDLTAKLFLAVCREENARRMAQMHPSLLKPTLIPNLAGAAYQVLRLVPARRRPPRDVPPAAPEAEPETSKVA
jgi:hypothetical protein